jgi:hypothetical protein
VSERTPPPWRVTPVAATAIDGATVAAIGLALALEASGPAVPAPGAGGLSAWTRAGRLAQLDRLTR